MQVVFRALSVLRVVARSSTPLSLNEISTQLELPVATVHRLLAALTREEFVVRDELTRRYSPGRALSDISMLQRPSHLPDIATPILQRLSEQFSETVFVASLSVDRAICVALIESSRPLRLNMRIGDHFPWHASASARAILAFQPPALIDQLLAEQSMDQFTPNTPRTTDEVHAHLVKVRRTGFDVCDDELDSGVWAVAAPILTEGAHVHGALGIGAPAERIRSQAQREDVIAAVIDGAKEISAAL